MEKLALVTGAGGFCGSFMVELLLEAGFKVRATDLQDSDRGVYKDCISKERVEFVPSDLTKKETLKEVLRDVEYVFHPAAVFSYSASYEFLERVNVFGTRNLCEAMLEEGKVKRFVNWSTAGIYGLPRPELLPINENTPANPSNLYEKSKWEQEKVCREFYQNHKLPLTIIRPVPIYGPRNIYGVAQILLGLLKFPVLAIPKNYRYGMPLVHVKDVCNSALFLSQKEEAIGEVYTIVDDSNFTLYDFIHLLGEISGKKVYDLPNVHLNVISAIARGFVWFLKILSRVIPHRVIIYLRETTLYSTGDYRLSNEKLKNLGYEFLYPSVKKGMRETLEWYRENNMLKLRKQAVAENL